MKKLLPLGLVCIALAAQAQTPIVINQNDMPDPGDTLRVSQTLTLTGNTYLQTGANQTWDFSNLVPLSQRVEKFLTVSSTGATNQLLFNNQLIFPNSYSSIAQELALPAIPGGLTLTDTYGFFRETSSQFRQTGYSGVLNGQTVPVAFTSPDVLYSFPMGYQGTDASASGYEINVPGTIYLAHQQIRDILADGWGTLITPFGTFETLRLVFP